MSPFLIGFLVFVLSIILSRLLHEKGFAILDDAQKRVLMRELSASRIFAFLPVIILVAAYYVLMYFLKSYSNLWVVGYMLLMFSYILVLNILRYKKLKRVELPAAYIFKHLIARTVQLLGLAFFLYIVAKDSIQNM